MPESVPVHCSACRREHVHTVPVYPRACGAPTGPCWSRPPNRRVTTAALYLRWLD
ncbi:MULTISPECIES: hypothetical protein [Streptomyces]|uniref:hypothetical protein n=1 Tax=Streptomyces TaxID=1883 RepID=UPI000A57B1C6|nr:MULTISPECIES: hypothetical protein [Streptomyces]